MPDISTLAVFCAATLGLLVVPGPAVLYIVTRSVSQGRTAGLISVLGIHTGSIVHIAAAALGISALLAASATAFTIVKYVGVAYLLWLGLRKLLNKGRGEEIVELKVQSKRRLFWEGFVVNVLNPKTAIFFLAFLPQFTNPAAGPIGFQILVFGLVWLLLGMASDGTYAMLASALAGRVRSSARARRRLDVGSGVVYLGLAAWLTTEKA
ncbi:RhtB family transporter [[Actinomadura] parvosata subsp. kistnae]|uniref:RhtB family transporter n=1 Tax=[Actinomadura] parvosata subsp. kistnae TaxID=1909395 RepID=A0A1V0A8K2_9ACTN|nr:LysE family translocator [Nonomuraea sp. ATCC 55076]AQZ66499.1 RhtB family transporter [Nonomuraea sp. ATCC 55076]SPL95436.1 RhtB family transporter [Actinomadura parvosata subsp. kistnae]